MRLSQVESPIGNREEESRRDNRDYSERTEINPMSPMRKQLVKDLTSYYNLLYETELLNETTEVTKAHEWKGNSSNQELTYFNPKSGYQAFEIDLMQYNEVDARSSRLEELKTLMKAELDFIELGHPIDPQHDEWEECVQGYPSMMQDRDDRPRNFHCGVHYLEGENNVGKYSQFRCDMHDILKNLTHGEVSEEDVASMRYHLLTLRTKRNYMLRNSTDEKLYDFHQRKGKEIRRRQYSSWIRERNKSEQWTERYPSPQKFTRVLVALGGMFRTHHGKQKFVRIGEKLQRRWTLVSVGGLFRTESGEFEFVVIPREVLLDLNQNVNENLLGFGVFYENGALDHDWIKVNDNSSESGVLLYVGARFCYEDNNEIRYFIRRVEWIEVRHSYYDWVFVNEEFALRVHRKRVTSKETTVPVETKKPGPKRPSPVQVEDRVKNIINNIDTSEKKYIVRDEPVEYEPEYIEKPSPNKPRYVEKPSPAKPKYVEKPRSSTIQITYAIL